MTKQQEKEAVNGLEDLLVVQLRGIYDVEAQLAKIMPRMIKKGTASELKEVFDQYRAQNEHTVKQLEEVFAILTIKPQKLPSAAIRGLIEDADWITKNIEGAAGIDAGLVAAMQAVQHYKLALYGSVFAWAKLLELHDVVDILEDIVHDADEGLEVFNELAASKVDEKALGEHGADEEEAEE